MKAMHYMLAAAWTAAKAPLSSLPTLVGPDNYWADMSASHLDAILNASALTELPLQTSPSSNSIATPTTSTTSNVIAAATYHDYQDPCVDAIDSGGDGDGGPSSSSGLVLNVSCFDSRMTQAAAIYKGVLHRHAGVELWLGEGALHSNSGVPGMTNVFESSLWYAHALGYLARSGVGMLCRQTLLGGDYEIVNRTTGQPNPDYYVALLWHDLVGTGGRTVTLDGCSSSSTWRIGEDAGAELVGVACADAVRVHAHTMSGDGGDGIVYVAINFAESTAFGLTFAASAPPSRSDYVSTTASSSSSRSNSATNKTGSMWQLTGHPQSNRIFLNGKPIPFAPEGSAPLQPLNPTQQSASAVVLPPASVTFFAIQN